MSPAESKAKEALRQNQFVTSKLGLTLHPEKTRIAEPTTVLRATVAVAQGDETVQTRVHDTYVYQRLTRARGDSLLWDCIDCEEP